METFFLQSHVLPCQVWVLPIGAFCSHITDWVSHCYFPVSFKPKVWEEGSTCNLTCMSWNESIFPNIGLISIIRKTKGTKAPVSSVLITLLVIRATIEIQDKTEKLEITLRRVIHGRYHWVQNRHACMCGVKQDLEMTQGWKWKSQLHKHWISENEDILHWPKAW